ncbi:MAG: Mur ligase family protein, partial [Desulfocapsaceae bacterium]
MPLTELMDNISGWVSARPIDASVVITELCADSRVVGPSSMFVAIKGDRYDGHRSLEEAVQRGAVAVVVDKGAVEQEDLSNLDAVIIEVDNSRAALALLASAFYRYPAKEMTLVGITGTNGKTTVSYLIEQTLRELGVQTGVIGTIEYRYDLGDGRSIRNPAPLTTPDPLTLQKMLREMADSGVSHLIMEASSHALQQHRLDS